MKLWPNLEKNKDEKIPSLLEVATAINLVLNLKKKNMLPTPYKQYMRRKYLIRRANKIVAYNILADGVVRPFEDQDGT